MGVLLLFGRKKIIDHVEAIRFNVFRYSTITTTTITTMRNFDYIQKYMENFGDKLSGLDRVKNIVTRRNATCLQVIC